MTTHPMTNPRPAPRPAQHHAFTLLEVLVSVAIMAVLATGITSVFLLASKALPTARGHTETSIAATAALDQLSADLRGAIAVTETTATSITFRVPDRDADTVDETIRYSWAGPGAPILRDYNTEVGAVVLPSAQAFAMEYTRRKETRSTTGYTDQDSGPNILFSSFDGWSGVSASISSAAVTPTAWASQAFPVNKVTFPADTVRWYVSRVSIRVAKALLTDPTVSVSICRPAATGNPVAGAAVGSPGYINTGLLGTLVSWQDATFSDVSFTDPSATNLVILMKASSTGGQLEYLNATSAPTDAYTLLWSTDSGGTWSPSSNRQRNDARFYVYGGYVRRVASTVNADVHFLGSVNVMLQPTRDADTRVDGGIALLNQPQAPAP